MASPSASTVVTGSTFWSMSITNENAYRVMNPPATVVTAPMSGTLAAVSPPKIRTSRISVIGRAISSPRRVSLSTCSRISRLVSSSPPNSTVAPATCGEMLPNCCSTWAIAVETLSSDSPCSRSTRTSCAVPSVARIAGSATS